MRYFLIVWVLITITATPIYNAQETSKSDIWSGRYAIYLQDDSEKAVDTLIITKINDADPAHLVSKLKHDLARWEISSARDSKKDSQVVRRFLTNKDDKNEYQEFGWEKLNENGKMNCIDGGHFFICQSVPETKIQFGKEEIYFSKTGIFGVWLHKGLVNLKKIN